MFVTCTLKTLSLHSSTDTQLCKSYPTMDSFITLRQSFGSLWNWKSISSSEIQPQYWEECCDCKYSLCIIFQHLLKNKILHKKEAAIIWKTLPHFKLCVIPHLDDPLHPSGQDMASSWHGSDLHGVRPAKRPKAPGSPAAGSQKTGGQNVRPASKNKKEELLCSFAMTNIQRFYIHLR